jgi:hypothetical protein
MSLLTLPEPDAAVLARRDVIVDREGCRTFETDAR